MTAAREKGPKAPVLRLVPRPPERRAPAVDRDTVRALAKLFEMAANGEVVGLALCAQYREGTYFVDIVGAARNNATFARGMVGALDDHLADLIGGRA